MTTLNGNKTWVGLIVLFLPGLVSDVSQVLSTPDDTFTKLVAIAGKLLIVIGAAHKVIKQAK